MTEQAVHNNAERKYEVTPLELLFDLVFAFAISQLSQHLLTHLSWRGAAEAHRLILHHVEKTSDPIRASRHSVNALISV